MSPRRFHWALRLLHWSMALGLLAMLFIGIAMVSTSGPAYPLLLMVHRPLGLLLLALACLRLAVRLATATPPLPSDLPPAVARAARGSHVLLYAAMIGMPVIGWAMLSAADLPIQLAPGLLLPPIVPADLTAYAVLRTVHMMGAFLFLALILGHLTAALVHALLRRDGVFDAMVFTRARASPAEEDVPEFVPEPIEPEPATPSS